MQEVINASRKCFPSMAASMDNPKVRVHVGDGVEFLHKCSQRAKAVESGEASGEASLDADLPSDGRFDVIITDNSNMDEIGSPNEALFQVEYFKNIHDVLRPPHGIMSSLGARATTCTVQYLLSKIGIRSIGKTMSYTITMCLHVLYSIY